MPGAVLGVVVLALVPHAGRERSMPEPEAITAALVPNRVARPAHLDTAYLAPRTSVTRPMGRLLIERLAVDAPVVAVGWDHDTMAVPNDPGILGWFAPSAGIDDLAGTSLIASHVADRAGVPGPFARLVEVRRGDDIVWRSPEGRSVGFRVVSITRYPRSAGLPTYLFGVDGPHMLRLVTCTSKVQRSGGFHYADNLVVSAVRISESG